MIGQIITETFLNMLDGTIKNIITTITTSVVNERM